MICLADLDTEKYLRHGQQTAVFDNKKTAHQPS